MTYTYRQEQELREALGRTDAGPVLVTIASRTDLAVALDGLVELLRRFVWFATIDQALAVALWVAHCHAIDAVDQSPILTITSPVKRSGKSRLLDIIETVVPNPWRMQRPTESVLFRRIARDRPTILMDEADTVFLDRSGQLEGIRSIFNSGNRRGTSVSRVLPRGKTFELVDFEIFGPKAAAGIGSFPETMVDRSIVIAMARQAPKDRTERLRARQVAKLGEPIRIALARSLAGVGSLSLDDDAIPPELDDRGQDNWESLLAIADLAGSAWPDAARAAAVSLNADRMTADDNAGLTLLADLATIYEEESGATFLTTPFLVERLHAFESSPWSEWKSGKPLSARGMAVLLRPFRIEPEHTRSGPATVRGYSRHQFVDHWLRYGSVPDVPGTQGSEEADDGLPL